MRETIAWAAAAVPAAAALAYPWLLYHPSSWPAAWAGALCLAAAAALGRSAGGFWDGRRRALGALAAILWGAYLLLWSRGLTLWLLDLAFAAAALLLWLGRGRAVPLLGSLGVVTAIGARHLGHPAAVLAVDLLYAAAALRYGGDVAERLARPAPSDHGALARARRLRGAGWAAGAAFLAFFALHGARQTLMMVSPARRRARLAALSPRFPIQDPGTLSPSAARLRAHVLELAKGERSAYEPAAQQRARRYISAQLASAGYAVRELPYAPERSLGFVRTAPFCNLEAVAPGTGPAWVVGAHYDSAPGTPGADDNASGVAVLLEAARLLKEGAPGREVRFVAFDAEEPPAFGSRDMGSYRYARGLRRKGVPVHALVNLEMLGYFNPRPGSQLYPPFLHLLYPDRGDSLGLVSNVRSVPLMREFLASWRRHSRLTMHGTVLPSVVSAVALSDQLNFWSEGYRAVMVSDTSFFRYPEYHQGGDTAEKLDYETMAEAARTLAAVLRERR
ncbi:MAG: M28 family peptidase [Elusimicrobia bacterium]|nr:M28 family peptidase [Elusimicrobiota bacterium]